MDSAKILNLVFLKALWMLEICSLEDDMEFEMLLLSIGTIDCLLKGLFVLILIQGFSFLSLLTVLLMFLIFFADKLKKFSLIFKTSLILANKA